jgi:hypothetical protein
MKVPLANGHRSVGGIEREQERQECSGVMTSSVCFTLVELGEGEGERERVAEAVEGGNIMETGRRLPAGPFTRPFVG